MASAARGRGPSRVRLLFFKLIERFQPDETAIMVVMAVLVGVVGGFGAILFRLMVDFFQGFAIGHGEHTAELLAGLPWWRKLLLPVVGGLVVGPLVHLGAREARGHGVPEVINSIVFGKGVIRPAVAAVKITASAVTIGFGGSVGREGPIVQIGAALGSSLGQWLRFSPQRLRTLIGCGAAAGIAATFNAPIAGAFFALEILLRDFAVATFSPVIVAAVVATAVSRQFLGDSPAFPVPEFVLGGPQELPFFLVMGLAVGLLAVVYVRTLYASEDAFARLPLPVWLHPAAGGILLGVLLQWFPQAYGVGYGTMVEALDGRMVWWVMLLLVAVKLLAVNITLGSGFSGGIFAPALFLGGMLGGGFGAVLGMALPGIHDPVGAFAMVGMAAMVGAATGGPLTAILMLFEMTGEYRVILPLMLASIGAALVYRALMRDSIFTLKFARRGQELQYGRESAVLQSYQVQDVMEVNPLTIRADAPLQEVLKLFLGNTVEHYYVVDAKGRLQGRISIHDVKEILHEDGLGAVIIAADVCSPQDHAVHRLDNLEDCLIALGHRDSTDLPVLYGPAHPVLVGVITRQAILEVYNREVLQHRDRGMQFVTGEARMRDCVELPEQYKVQLLTPPDAWYGRTLRELELRQGYGISVLAVKRHNLRGGPVNHLPDPDRALAPGDRLIIVGEAVDLDRLLMDLNPRAFPAGDKT
ncbi:MAG: chloride channel protein [Krumholzibacteria bacterium]|nr:chloride channel protein [Candidatus Krumholzibacteria bacterium]